MNSYKWYFPLRTTHEGMLAGNGTMGIMVFGEESTLKITIGRADLWDHRGGLQWSAKQNYNDIKQALEENDADAIHQIFQTDTENVDGLPSRPSIVPIGRFDIRLPDEAKLTYGETFFKKGIIKVFYSYKSATKAITISQSIDTDIVKVEFEDEDDIKGITPVTSWKYQEDFFKSISFEPPTEIHSDNILGWEQKLPADPSIQILSLKDNNKIWISSARGGNTEEHQAVLIEVAQQEDIFDNDLQNWWNTFWKDIPVVDIPNEDLMFLYYYGMYKFATFTNPEGTPATLQGPWIEEYDFPPWSSDYHFNINVQMCYWPAYQSGKLEHLMPMFNLVLSWQEKMQQNAKLFIGIDDGYMLPHAVDDRCTCMGSFWTGTIDHACTAWIAIMMFEYVEYINDFEFLKSRAFPFMRGAMRVYEEMLEWDGDICSLPVSVSPEYRGSQMNAWGKNASFQLAAMHKLLEDLQSACKILNETEESSWSKIQKGLPKFSTTNSRIALWEGTDLEESHRHHSHLGSIAPFDVIDPFDPQYEKIISGSLNHWVKQGMGLWSGWCMTWASMLHSRMQNGTMAEAVLELWKKFFTNKGHGSLHDANSNGLSIMGAPGFNKPAGSGGCRMQMDGAMGAIKAIQEMLVHSRRDVYHIFSGVPERWTDCKFENMSCKGTVKISSEVIDGNIEYVKLTTQSATTFRIGNPWKDSQVSIDRNGIISIIEGDILEIEIKAGEEIVISA
ncbi:MAG: hypothetical protein PF692_12705 [Kiritimatiellae bacterium]|jgi:alpha-L-fucosidase 2|nr:hypothetical protein [Kiritimatiellia bacterium]